MIRTDNNGNTILGYFEDGGRILRSPEGRISAVNAGMSTSDPTIIQGLLEGVPLADVMREGWQRSAIQENPIFARAVTAQQGIPFIGEWFDELYGLVGGPEAAEGTRFLQESMAEQRPLESLALQVGTGVAATAPLAIAAAPAVLGQGTSLASQTLRGLAAGTSSGAVEGAVAGAGANEEDRLGGAQSGAILGGALGGTLGAAAPAVISGGTALARGLRDSLVRRPSGTPQGTTTQPVSEPLPQARPLVQRPSVTETEVPRPQPEFTPASAGSNLEEAVPNLPPTEDVAPQQQVVQQEDLETEFETFNDAQEIFFPTKRAPLPNPFLDSLQTQSRPGSIPRFETIFNDVYGNINRAFLFADVEGLRQSFGMELKGGFYPGYAGNISVHDLIRADVEGTTIADLIDEYGWDPEPETVRYVEDVRSRFKDQYGDFYKRYQNFLRDNPGHTPNDDQYNFSPVRQTEFRSPLQRFIQQVKIPSKGLLGSQLIKQIRDNPDIRFAEFNSLGLEIEPQKRYTQEDLSSLFEDSFYTPFVTETSNYSVYQRQKDYGLTGVRERNYFELQIRATPGPKNAGFLPNSGGHFGPDVLAHTRASSIRIDGQSAILVEELQSDLLQQGYSAPVKEKKLSFEDQLSLIEKAINLEIADRESFRLENYSAESLISVNNSWMSLDETQKKQALRLASDEDTSYGRESIAYLESLPQFLTASYRDLRTLVSILRYNSVNRVAPINSPPISRTEDTVRLSLDALMAKGQESGAFRIIIPPFERIVAARFDPETKEYQNALDPKSGFYATYITSLNKVLKQYQEEFGDAFIVTQKDLEYIDDDGNVVLLPGTQIDFRGLVEQGYDLTRPRFAEGGMVTEDMETQMNTLLQEGGIADDGMTRDPVSGNEIPPGSMAEEVRDDVDAKLSQGEYVVPADVVRFFGVAFFEGLRSKAKEGLAEMESNGRIGGEPALSEPPMRELPMREPMPAEMQMAKGGDVGIDKDARRILESLKRSPQLRERLQRSGVTIKMAEGGDVGTQTQAAFNVPFQNVVGFSTLGSNMGTAPQQNIEYKTYENTAGDTRVIMFINGQPQQPIPQGFYPQGEVPKEEEKERKDEDPNLIAPTQAAPRTPAVNLYGMNEDELSTWAQGGIGGSFLSGAGGLVGTAADLDAISRVRAAARVAADQGYTALQTQLESSAKEMQEDLGWLGDLLQGTIATGEQYYEDQQQFRQSRVPSTSVTPQGSSTRRAEPIAVRQATGQSRASSISGTTASKPAGYTPVGGGSKASTPQSTPTQSKPSGGPTPTPTQSGPAGGPIPPKLTTPPAQKQQLMARGGLIKRPNT